MRTRHAFRTYVSFLGPVPYVYVCVRACVCLVALSVRAFFGLTTCPVLRSQENPRESGWKFPRSKLTTDLLGRFRRKPAACVTGLRFLENRSSQQWNSRCLWHISGLPVLCLTFENRVFETKGTENFKWENFSSVLEEIVNTIEKIELSLRDGRLSE